MLGACARDPAASRRRVVDDALPANACVGATALEEEGCARARAACDVEKRRCEHENVRRIRDDGRTIIVPCDLDYDLCLGRCRPAYGIP